MLLPGFKIIQGPLSQKFKTSKHIIRWNSPSKVYVKCKCVVFNHAWQIIHLIRAQNCVLGYYRHALKRKVTEQPNRLTLCSRLSANQV